VPKLHKTTGDRSRDMIRRRHSDPVFHGALAWTATTNPPGATKSNATTKAKNLARQGSLQS
jgi:hypothetical protein